MAGFAAGWVSERDIRPAARMRLFCLPHAGSGAAAFYRWKRELPGWVDVCPVLLPGRELRLREPSLIDSEEVIARLMDATAALLDVPYAIFGHSMGALLAYEWARRIRAAGLRSPACLFCSGRDAANGPLANRELHRLEDAEFIDALRQRFGGMPADFLTDKDLREVFLPILRADLRLVETYRHDAGAPLDCPLRAFAGEQDETVSAAGLLAWGELTTGNFEARRFPGDHFYHIGDAQQSLLAAIVETLSTHSSREAKTR